MQFMQQENQALDIIPRTPFYSNKMMADSISLIRDVVLATVIKKEKVGKKVVEVKVPKFKTDKEVIDRILRSYEYYSNPNTEEMKQVKEVSVSGGVQFRDYQTRIINDGYKIRAAASR